MRRASDFIRGGAELTVSGADTARFLRRCAESGLLLEEVRQEEPFTCRLRLPLRDLDRAKELSERCGCVLTVLRRTGLPQAARAARRRGLLAVGMLLAALALAASSLFVWEIQVTENDTRVSDGEILRVLSAQGVGVGSFWPDFHADLIRSRALSVLPELSWLAVNMNGTRALVQVRGLIGAEPIRDPGAPTDVCALRGGVITDLTVLEGTPLVRRGDAVEPGQVLISADRPAGAAGHGRIVHAAGEVRGRTWREMNLSAPLFYTEKTRIGRSKTRFGVLLGDKLYFFSRSSGISPPDCDRMTQIKRLGVEGLFSLPLAVVTEKRQAYVLTERERDAEQLRADLEEELTARLRQQIGEEGEVISAFFTAKRHDGVLTLTLRAECSERLDREIPRDNSAQEG